MQKEIFHTCRCIGKTFTQEEWSIFCKRSKSDDVVLENEGYGFNINDVCVSGYDTISWSNRVCSFDILTAKSPSGNWSYATKISCHDRSSGYLPKYVDSDHGYPTKDLAIYMAIKECVVFFRDARKDISKQHFDEDEKNNRPHVISSINGAISKLHKMQDTYANPTLF